MYMNITKVFGENLKKIRIKKGITQEKLSVLSKLHRTYISDIERGNKNLSLKNIEKLSRALGVDIKEFFTT